MASLIQIFDWFKENLMPTEAQFQETWKSFWHKSEKLPIEQILGLKEEIAKVTTNFKGYHTSLAALQAAYPQAQNKKDYFAWVGSPYPGTVYKVFANGGAWTDTGEIPTQQEIDLAEYAKNINQDGDKVVYSPTGKLPDNIATYIEGSNITAIAKNHIRKNAGLNLQNGTIDVYQYADCVVYCPIKPNSTYVLSGITHPRFCLYSEDGGNATQILDYESEPKTIKTNENENFISFYVRVQQPHTGDYWDFDNTDTFSLLEVDESTGDEKMTTSLVLGNKSIQVDNLVTFAKGETEDVDLTESSKTYRVNGAGPSPSDGKINPYEYADCIAYLPVNPNTTYRLENITHPQVCLYSQLNGTATRILMDDVQPKVITTTETERYISFYVRVQQPVGFPDRWNYDDTNTFKVIKNAITDAPYVLILGDDKYSFPTNGRGGVAINTNNRFPFPRTVGRIDIIGDLTGISKENPVLVKVRIDFGNGIIRELYAWLAWQGTSSIAYDKKNYSIDFVDDNGDSVSLKIGDWVETDSYHFKVNYIDAMHCRNICACRLIEQTYRTRDVSVRRPWNLYNDFAANDVRNNYDTGAMGHIDGYAFEMYQNGTYYGLGTLNLKKDRKNYALTKGNVNHIHLEMSESSVIQSPIDWTKWEIRNPKGFTANVEPPSGAVKTAITNFFAWAQSVTNTSPKSEFEAHMAVPFWLDFNLINWMIDNYDGMRKNSQIITHDGIHFSPMNYDLDSIMGLYWNGSSIFRTPTADPTIYNGQYIGQPLMQKFEVVFADEMKARYKELRDKKVFDVQNITNLFNDFFVNVGIEAYQKDWKKWTAIPSLSIVTIKQIEDYVRQRLVFLDNKYGYGN